MPHLSVLEANIAHIKKHYTNVLFTLLTYNNCLSHFAHIWQLTILNAHSTAHLHSKLVAGVVVSEFNAGQTECSRVHVLRPTVHEAHSAQHFHVVRRPSFSYKKHFITSPRGTLISCLMRLIVKRRRKNLHPCNTTLALYWLAVGLCLCNKPVLYQNI